MTSLLSPAGSPEALKAAIDGGADEVYLGGNALNARTGAKNFDNAALVKAGELCRANNVRICITLNTLVTDRELKSALEFADFLEREVRPYAYIVQDLGLAAELKRKYPSVLLHASTQAAQHSADGVALFGEMGFSRVVLARECSRETIKAAAATGIETEVFIHGALCVSQSGGCLMSSFIGKRSGNRGECAQPCRLDYAGKTRYPLSLKDLCLAAHIPELLDFGVSALKIEGRMKSPDYVYTVTSIYRRLIDQKRPPNDREREILRAAFSRSGFTDGYYTRHIASGMFGTRNNDERNTFLVQKPTAYLRKPVVSRETNLNLPTRDEATTIPAKEQKGAVLRFATPPDKGFASLAGEVARFDLPLWMVDQNPFPTDKVSAVLPRVISDEDTDSVLKLLEKAYESGIRQVTLSNISHIRLCKGFYIHGDMMLNAANKATLEVLNGFSLSSASLSAEIMPYNPVFLPMALEYPVYGRLPLMHTSVCIIKNLGSDCAQSGCRAVLRDRINAEFPILREFGHKNIIYNSVPLVLTDKCRELKKVGVGLYTLYITDESPEFVKCLLSAMKEKTPPKGSFTRGYWK